MKRKINRGLSTASCENKATDEDFYNQNIANAQYLYWALHFPARLQQVDSELFSSLVGALNDSTISTLLSGYTALALGAYNQQPSTQGDAQLSIVGLQPDGKEAALAPFNADFLRVNIDAGIKQITFKNPVKLNFFYQLLQAGFDKTLPKKAVNDGIEVFREITNANNVAVTSATLGEEIVVHIRARATDNQYHTNTALVDLLPGGFEVVRASVNQQDADYVDVREDRVIFFATIGPESKEISYKIKAVTSGKFIVPPMFGMSMYNPMIKSLGLAGSLTVSD